MLSRRVRSLDAEHELLLRCVMCGELRVGGRARICQLVGLVDPVKFADLLVAHGLLGIVGSRLISLYEGELPTPLHARVQAAAAFGRGLATWHEALTARAIAELGRNEIPAVALKGVFLAEALYGDPANRASSDIDILVPADQLERATRALVSLGYQRADDARGPDGLPELHQTLEHTAGGPNVELHWRVHWYERDFGEGVLQRAKADRQRGGIIDPSDELAILLLSFAKDAFIGLRYATDISAWWDVHGDRLGRPPLDAILERHPELVSAVLTAAQVAERLTGVPARRLHSSRWKPSLRGRVAARMANSLVVVDGAEAAAEVSLVDWLLSSWSGQVAFLRRHITLSHVHGLRARTTAKPPVSTMVAYDVAGILKLIRRYYRSASRFLSRPLERPPAVTPAASVAPHAGNPPHSSNGGPPPQQVSSRVDKT